MRRLVILLLSLTVTGTAVPAFARAPSITVANQAIQGSAIVENGHVLLPLRATFEALNSSVTYDPAHGTITARNILHHIRLHVGSRRAYFDGRAITLDAAPKLVRGQVYVPLRFAANAMGAIIRYDAHTNTVAINGSPPAAQHLDIAHPPQELNPPPNSSVVTAYPVVSASLGSAMAASNAVTLAIDGTDVTQQSAFDGRTITFVPKEALAQGRHTASFSGRTSNGQPFSTQWSFATNAAPMDSDVAYSYNDYRFFAGPVQPFGTSSLMNLTLVAPPTGSGFVQICNPNFIYPLWNGGSQLYRARILVPRTFVVGTCPITAIFIGRHGRRIFIPITPMNNGLYLTGNPINPIGQYPSAPIFVPVLPQHP